MALRCKYTHTKFYLANLLIKDMIHCYDALQNSLKTLLIYLFTVIIMLSNPDTYKCEN